MSKDGGPFVEIKRYKFCGNDPKADCTNPENIVSDPQKNMHYPNLVMPAIAQI